MYVDGPLQKAQFENLANTSPTPTPTGRMYCDTTNPASAIPKFYNGSAWVALATTTTSGAISQNSGKAVTVNWATGLDQQVILTDNCSISFSNPVTGKQHTLIVTQVQRDLNMNSVDPFVFTLNMPDQDSRRDFYQPQRALPSGESMVFRWIYQAGIKSAYATMPSFLTPTANLSTLATGVAFNPFTNTVALGRTTSPFLQTIRFADTGGRLSYLTKVDQSTPTTAAAQAVAVCYHPDGHTMFMATGTTPFIQAFYLDTYGVPNAGTYSNPGTLPTGAGQCLAIHPSGAYIAIGHTTTPFLSAYLLTPGSFSTRITNPGTLPVAQVNAVAFSPLGDYVAVGSQTTPFLQVYPFTSGSFGSVLSNPGTLPAGGPPGALGKGIAWHPTGTFLAMCMSVTPYLVVYPFNRTTGVFGTPLTPLGTGAPAATMNCAQFSPDGNYLVGGNSAGLFIWDFSNNTFPAGGVVTLDTAFGTQINDITFHPSGEIMFVATNASQFVYALNMPRKAKNYLRYII